MWPIILGFLRSKVVYITFPVAFVIGFIGYNVENLVSDKYTPYSESIQEKRIERLRKKALLINPTEVEDLRVTHNVLEQNLSPSLTKK